MAVDKGLVLAAIDAKFKGKSLSRTFKDNLATKWAAKIDNETDIDDFIEAREDIVLEAEREANSRVTDALKKANAGKKDDNGQPDSGKTEDPEPDPNMPDWAKAILKQNAEMAKTLTTFQNQQTQKTIADRFKAHEDLKGIPEFMFKGRVPATEEGFEDAVAELKADYAAFAQEHKISAIGKDTPPGGAGGAGGQDGQVSAEIKAFVDKNIKKD